MFIHTPIYLHIYVPIDMFPFIACLGYLTCMVYEMGGK